MSKFFVGLAILAVATYAQSGNNDGIALPSGFGPHCGPSTGTVAKDLNNGLPSLNTFKTIVSFGDSYTTAGKHDGTTQAPAVIVGTNPEAGGRATNGPVWIENIANDIGATWMNYAVGGAVTSSALWPSSAPGNDFINQTNIFLGQKHTLSSSTTLYTVFFGINDFAASSKSGTGNLPAAAQVVLNQIKILTNSPTNGRNFLITDVYHFGKPAAAAGDNYKSIIFEGLNSLRSSNSAINYGYVDFKYIFDAVSGNDVVADGVSQFPFQSFGYTSNGSCTLNSSTTVGDCSDPAHTFFWIPSHPSKETHRIMGNYVEKVLTTC